MKKTNRVKTMQIAIIILYMYPTKYHKIFLFVDSGAMFFLFAPCLPYNEVNNKDAVYIAAKYYNNTSPIDYQENAIE